MQFSVVKTFFNTPVVIVVHGHVMEGVLTEFNPFNSSMVVLTSVPSSVMVYDGYVLGPTSLVEVSSIDVIRSLTPVAG